MKKIINFRFFFYISLDIAVLIFGICEIYLHNLMLGLICVITATLTAAAIIIFYRNWLIKILVFIIFLTSVLSITLILKFWQGNTYESQEVIFTLTDDITAYENTVTAVGQKISIGGVNLSGKVFITISTDKESYLTLRAGDKLKIYSCDLISVRIIENNKINSSEYKADIKYYINCNEYDVRRYSGTADILSMVRYKIKDIIFDNLDDDTAAVSYAMIVGDREYISKTLTQNYTVSGLAHILAVSGLNISFLIICVNFLSSRIKGFRLLKFLLLMGLLAFYCAICGFVPSVVRAGLMGVISLAAGYFGKKVDLLNSLGLSSMIMLIFKPLYIYDLSFLLSFSSVFGIICLYSPISALSRKFLRGRFGHKIADLAAVTLAANIGVFPLMAHYFNSLSPYSLFTNIILLPIINIAFLGLFVGCLMAVLIPLFDFAVIPAGLIIGAVNKITSYIKDFPYANIIVFSLGGTVIIYYIIVFFLGGHINIPKKANNITAIVLAVFLTAAIIIANISPVKNLGTFTVLKTTGGEAGILITQSNEKYIIGEIDFINQKAIRNFLIDEKIRDIDGIILTDISKDTTAIIDIANSFEADSISISTEDYALCDELYLNSGIKINQIFSGIDYTVGSLKISSYMYSNIRLGIEINYLNRYILFPYTTDENHLEILNTLSNHDIIVSPKNLYGLEYMLYFVFWDKNDTSNVISLSKTGNYRVSL